MKSLLFFILYSYSLFSQIQIGNSINGEAMGDNFGHSISLSSDGSKLAIGAIYNSENGTSAGHVRVFQNISGTWVQVGLDIDGVSSSIYSGSSISLSSDGSILAIGAPFVFGSGPFFGQVRVYQNISGVWTQIGSPINGEASFNYFGSSISMSANGNIIAVSAPGNIENGTATAATGNVRIFQNISGVWTQIGSDIYGNLINLGCFKVSLSSNGNIVAISSIEDYGDDSGRGFVRIFQNISGVWTQIGTTLYGEANGNKFGYSISLSSDGTILAVSAKDNSTNLLYSGSVSVYQNISGVWTQIGTTIYGQTEGIYFGSSISMSANGTIIAATSINNLNQTGETKIYKNVSGNWIQVGVTINGENQYDDFGTEVSLSPDGSKLAISAPYNDVNGPSSGHVRVYDLTALLRSDSFILDNFSIYPNPTSTLLNINLQKELVLEKVIIYSVSGQIINTETSKTFNISNLSKGTYFIEVVTDKGKATKTFIKE